MLIGIHTDKGAMRPKLCRATCICLMPLRCNIYLPLRRTRELARISIFRHGIYNKKITLGGYIARQVKVRNLRRPGNLLSKAGQRSFTTSSVVSDRSITSNFSILDTQTPEVYTFVGCRIPKLPSLLPFPPADGPSTNISLCQGSISSY